MFSVAICDCGPTLLSIATIVCSESVLPSLSSSFTSQTTVSILSISALVISALVPAFMARLTAIRSPSINGKKVVLTKPPPISPGTVIKKIATIVENAIHGCLMANLKAGL